MKALRCDSCGAPMTDSEATCSYCGTNYESYDAQESLGISSDSMSRVIDNMLPAMIIPLGVAGLVRKFRKVKP